MTDKQMQKPYRPLQDNGSQYFGDSWDTLPTQPAPVQPVAEQQLANYTLTIDADSGYESTTEGRCTAEQYGQAMAALHGTFLAAQPAPVQHEAWAMAFIEKMLETTPAHSLLASQVFHELRQQVNTPAPVQGPVPDYAWPTVADYEKDVGFEVNDAFKMAWGMARTTNALFTQVEKNNG